MNTDDDGHLFLERLARVQMGCVVLQDENKTKENALPEDLCFYWDSKSRDVKYVHKPSVETRGKLSQFEYKTHLSGVRFFRLYAQTLVNCPQKFGLVLKRSPIDFKTLLRVETRRLSVKGLPDWLEGESRQGWFAPNADPHAPGTLYLSPRFFSRRTSGKNSLTVRWAIRQVGVDKEATFFEEASWDDEKLIEAFALMALNGEEDSVSVQRALDDDPAIAEYIAEKTFWENHEKLWKELETSINQTELSKVILRTSEESFSQTIGKASPQKYSPITIGDSYGLTNRWHKNLSPDDEDYARNIGVDINLQAVFEQRFQSFFTKEVHSEFLQSFTKSLAQLSPSLTLLRYRFKESSFWPGATFVVTSPEMFLKIWLYRNAPISFFNYEGLGNGLVFEKYNPETEQWESL